MLKKIGFVVALVGICALSLFLINCGNSSYRPTSLLYVLTQGSTGVGNNVTSYSIDENSGNLTWINSNANTCPTASTTTNPEPCGLPLDILLDSTGATAFVLNQGVPCPEVEFYNSQLQINQMECATGSNPPVAPTIYSFTVNSDGSLSNPGTAVTWSCPGVTGTSCAYNDTPVAMARDTSGKYLFVIGEGSNPTPGTTNPAVYATCPHAPTTAFDVCPSISVFAMTTGSNGSTSLSLVGTPTYLSKIPSALSAITFTPPNGATPPTQCGFGTNEEFLYVTNNHDLSQTPPPYDSTVSVYCVSSSGTLINPNPQTQTLPYVTQGDPISVLAVNTNLGTQANNGGVFVYVGSQPGNASGTVGVFQMCTSVNSNGSNCTSTDVGNAQLYPVTTETSAGQNPVAMVVDPTNSFLYVVYYMTNQVWGYSIAESTGKLTPLNPSNLATGTSPVAMALHASVNNTGQFLYSSNSGSNNISGWALSTTTGSMSALTTVIAPETPSGMAAR
jgi:hypothetical protein